MSETNPTPAPRAKPCPWCCTLPDCEGDDVWPNCDDRIECPGDHYTTLRKWNNRPREAALEDALREAIQELEARNNAETLGDAELTSLTLRLEALLSREEDRP